MAYNFLRISVIIMSKPKPKGRYVSRGGEKLEHAIREFKISVDGLTCADFGCSTGGFTDCLLQHGAKKVYAVDTGYGVLDYKLRTDPRVVVMERTNAMHVGLPELVDLITIDTSWTRLEKLIGNAFANLKVDGSVIALTKPHYEADRPVLTEGKLSDEVALSTADGVVKKTEGMGYKVVDGPIESPIRGGKGGNLEFLVRMQ